MAKISIIVPIYNEEKYLENCVKSVMKQTLDDIEIICVDDGSTDASVQQMDQFALEDSRIKVIHKPNSGYGNSMNRGLAAATGDYIGIVESDDYIVPEMYEKLYALTENGTVDVVKGNFWDCYDEKDGSITKVKNRERSNMPDVEAAFILREYPQILWGHPSIWTGIYRRAFLLENHIQFQEEKGGGWVDNPFFFATLCKAKSIKWTQEPFYCYRKTNAASSSSGYNLRLPFDRMMDNLRVVEENHYTDEETLKYMYARALMYLCGATQEAHYAYNEDYTRPFMQAMLKKMNPDVIMDDFNVWDQKTYLKYLSPLDTLMPKTTKILIYNWVPFDNPGKVGGGVTIYCKNLIETILRYRPDVQVYFLSSGWAYDVTTTKCYFRRLSNVFGDRCRSFEIVNSPVPAAQDMLFYNPEFAFENEELKDVFSDFIQKNGPFSNIHFNNIEGLSLDVFDLKKEYPETRFVYSMHNYVPICMTGFYFRRDKHCNCAPDHTAADCGKCIDRDDNRKIRTQMVNRAKVNIPDVDRYNDDRWALKFGFEKLDLIRDESLLYEYTVRAKRAINENMDIVLAVSDRVRALAEENGIDPKLLRTSYIGTKIASYQVGYSTAAEREYFKVAYLGSHLDYEEKGYPFLIDSLAELDEEHAGEIDLVLTTTTWGRDEWLQDKLKNFHSVEIIHGYTHADLTNILRGVQLGIIPVLWEDNLPQVAIEMVALGVPILCSSAGGASELCSSEKFRFEAGNQKEFLDKLTYFTEHRDEVKEYWDNHKGLVTMKMHFDELAEIFDLPEAPEATISIEDYSNLLAENEFLYRNFNGNQNVAVNGVSMEEVDRLRRENSDLHNRVEDLQYRLDETWKSKSFKIGRAITTVPRKFRGDRG